MGELHQQKALHVGLGATPLAASPQLPPEGNGPAHGTAWAPRGAPGQTHAASAQTPICFIQTLSLRIYLHFKLYKFPSMMGYWAVQSFQREQPRTIQHFFSTEKHPSLCITFKPQQPLIWPWLLYDTSPKTLLTVLVVSQWLTSGLFPE